MKIVWNLPLPTHTRFLESLSPIPHLEATLSSRYIGFVENLRNCTKPFINLLFNSIRMDVSSQTGNNIRFLMDKYSKKTLQDLIRWKPMISKTRITPLSEDENWKVRIVEEISLILKGHLDMEFDNPHLEEILTFVCTD